MQHITSQLNTHLFQPRVGIVLYDKTGFVLQETPNGQDKWDFPQYDLMDKNRVELETKMLLKPLLPKSSYRLRAITQEWYQVPLSGGIFMDGKIGIGAKWIAVEIVNTSISPKLLGRDNVKGRVLSFDEIAEGVKQEKRQQFKFIQTAFKGLIRDKVPLAKKWQDTRSVMYKQIDK